MRIERSKARLVGVPSLLYEAKTPDVEGSVRGRVTCEDLGIDRQRRPKILHCVVFVSGPKEHVTEVEVGESELGIQLDCLFEGPASVLEAPHPHLAHPNQIVRFGRLGISAQHLLEKSLGRLELLQFNLVPSRAQQLDSLGGGVFRQGCAQEQQHRSESRSDSQYSATFAGPLYYGAAHGFPELADWRDVEPYSFLVR